MNIEVEVQQGKVRGQEKLSTGFNKIKYYSFQGIPYAKPPIGSLRFKDPEEPDVWPGVRDCLAEGNVAPQFNMLFGYPQGNEDCLYLNVYTPKLPDNKNFSSMPVMVYLHGGGFTSGSGGTDLYGPDYLIEQCVVIVTLNYRLGLLGFLSLENCEAPGNAGLKDQVMALRWVQKNILKFGGDPCNVTLFGESAGGASVHYHLLSPLSKGVGHGDEIFLLFSQSLKGVPKVKSSSHTQKVIENVTKMWTSFAQTGNPNYTGIETQWRPATKDKFCYLDINDKLQIVNRRVAGERMEFWQQLYHLYHHRF